VHVIVSALLVGAVLLQVGRGASTGASFGAGSGAFFGPTGATSFLGKVIVVLAVLFMVTTIVLYFGSLRRPPQLTQTSQRVVESEAVV
jgi:preprotein translocase subunit SecG